MFDRDLKYTLWISFGILLMSLGIIMLVTHGGS